MGRHRARHPVLVVRTHDALRISGRVPSALSDGLSPHRRQSQARGRQLESSSFGRRYDDRRLSRIAAAGLLGTEIRGEADVARAVARGASLAARTCAGISRNERSASPRRIRRRQSSAMPSSMRLALARAAGPLARWQRLLPQYGSGPAVPARLLQAGALLRADWRYDSLRPSVTGMRAARTAGKSPPTKPIANAHFRPSAISAGVTRNWNTIEV